MNTNNNRCERIDHEENDFTGDILFLKNTSLPISQSRMTSGAKQLTTQRLSVFSAASKMLIISERPMLKIIRNRTKCEVFFWDEEIERRWTSHCWTFIDNP
jgi:hypothetical protein